jgi:hypothetical protein
MGQGESKLVKRPLSTVNPIFRARQSARHVQMVLSRCAIRNNRSTVTLVLIHHKQLFPDLLDQIFTAAHPRRSSLSSKIKVGHSSPVVPGNALPCPPWLKSSRSDHGIRDPQGGCKIQDIGLLCGMEYPRRSPCPTLRSLVFSYASSKRDGICRDDPDHMTDLL